MNQNEQFFANNNANTNANYLNDEQKIQEILQEQQKLQQLYNRSELSPEFNVFEIEKTGA